MALTPEEATQLTTLEAEFAAAGGRGVDLANEIDELRTKRDLAEYEVTLRNTFEASSPEDAVRQMIEWVEDNASQTGYRVKAEDGTSVFIDGDDVDLWAQQ